MVTKDFTVSRIGAPRSCTHHKDCKSFSIAIVDEKKRDQSLVLHAQGKLPIEGAQLKRKRLGHRKFVCVWPNADGSAGVFGDGFTTGAVPSDWGQLQW